MGHQRGFREHKIRQGSRPTGHATGTSIDFITDRQAFHPGANFLNGAGNIAMQDGRPIRCNCCKPTLANLGIHRIDAGGRDANQYMFRRNLRAWQFHLAKYLRPTKAIDYHRMHSLRHRDTPASFIHWFHILISIT